MTARASRGTSCPAKKLSESDPRPRPAVRASSDFARYFHRIQKAYYSVGATNRPISIHIYRSSPQQSKQSKKYHTNTTTLTTIPKRIKIVVNTRSIPVNKHHCARLAPPPETDCRRRQGQKGASPPLHILCRSVSSRLCLLMLLEMPDA